MLCQLTVIGSVVREPELKKCSNGESMLRFTVKTFDRGTNWINVQVFRTKTAEYYSDILKAGSLVYVQGKYVVRDYEDKGEKKRFHSLSVDFDGRIKVFDNTLGFVDPPVDTTDGQGSCLDNGDSTGIDPAFEDDIPF